VLIDEAAHSSLRDAAGQFRVPIQTFKHGDPADLAAVLAGGGGDDKPILLTEGLFGGTGEIAPLAEYLRVLPANALILLDDAHGAGVLGTRGQGTPEHAGVSRHRVIQTITLSKALGVYGGAILTTRALREKMIQSSPMFTGATPLPPPLAQAALQSIKIIRADRGLRERLARNTAYSKSFLRERGIALPDTPAPIISVQPSTPGEAVTLRRRLLSRRIFPSFIRYQGGKAAARFRFALSSEHRRGQLDALLDALAAKPGRPR
jgi:7-keto-8-aminopelargonate synthetase-like enzyme